MTDRERAHSWQSSIIESASKIEREREPKFRFLGGQWAGLRQKALESTRKPQHKSLIPPRPPRFFLDSFFSPFSGGLDVLKGSICCAYLVNTHVTFVLYIHSYLLLIFPACLFRDQPKKVILLLLIVSLIALSRVVGLTGQGGRLTKNSSKMSKIHSIGCEGGSGEGSLLVIFSLNYSSLVEVENRLNIGSKVNKSTFLYLNFRIVKAWQQIFSHLC